MRVMQLSHFAITLIQSSKTMEGFFVVVSQAPTAIQQFDSIFILPFILLSHGPSEIWVQSLNASASFMKRCRYLSIVKQHNMKSAEKRCVTIWKTHLIKQREHLSSRGIACSFTEHCEQPKNAVFLTDNMKESFSSRYKGAGG